MVIKINMVGLLKDKIMNFITDFDLGDIHVDCKEKHYETSVDIDGDGDKVDDLIRDLYTEFKPNIYGTNEENIYKAVFELLKFKKLKLAIVEDVSAGRLCSELIGANYDINDVLLEGIVCFSDESKCVRLGVDRAFFDTHTSQSVECSYELASGMIMTSSADLVIATTGFADVNSPDNGKCFIAVGDRDFIHVFKHHFEGSKNHILQQISKFAFLHLIKKLRENDFDFVENVI